MAGNPKKKLRELEQSLRAQGVDPATLPQQPAKVGVTRIGGATGARARADAPAHARSEHLPMGSTTRAELDRAQSNDLLELHAALRPSTVVRIIRTRPTWIAGIAEEFELERGGTRELVQHITEEYGGQMYRIEVLTPDGRVAFSSKLEVMAPVKFAGRKVTRAQWEGTEEEDEPRGRSRNAVQNPPPPPAAPQLDVMGIATIFANMLKDTRAESASMVDKFLKASEQQTNTVVKAIADRDTSKDKGDSFLGQLQAVTEATRAIKDMKEELADDAPPPAAAPGEQKNSMLKDLAMAAMGNELAISQARRAGVARANARTAQQAPTQQQAPQQQPPPQAATQPASRGSVRRLDGKPQVIN